MPKKLSRPEMVTEAIETGREDTFAIKAPFAVVTAALSRGCHMGETVNHHEYDNTGCHLCNNQDNPG